VLAGRFGVQLSEGTRDLLVFSKVSGPSLGPTQSVSGLKRLGSEADYSLPSSAEVNEWSYVSLPPVWRMEGQLYLYRANGDPNTAVMFRL